LIANEEHVCSDLPLIALGTTPFRSYLIKDLLLQTVVALWWNET